MRKPADAKRYAVEQEAEGAKSAAIRSAEAERARREAAAEALRAEGAAEADAIRARGEAEAKAMEQKADAYDRYGDAAIIDVLSAMLPNLVREAAAPLGAIDKVTVISTDGASQMTKNVATNVTQGMQIANDLLGVDLATLVGKLAKGSAEFDAPTASEPDAVPPAG